MRLESARWGRQRPPGGRVATPSDLFGARFGEHVVLLKSAADTVVAAYTLRTTTPRLANSRTPSPTGIRPYSDDAGPDETGSNMRVHNRMRRSKK